jgi:hypothetical protein
VYFNLEFAFPLLLSQCPLGIIIVLCLLLIYVTIGRTRAYEGHNKIRLIAREVFIENQFQIIILKAAEA